MINIYSSRNINIISFILTTIIFSISYVGMQFSKPKGKAYNEESEQLSIVQEKENEKIIPQQKETDLTWYIEIPAINLKAPIEETTQMEVLNTYVGHFEETPKEHGNIGLAAHNRGYEKNYFKDIKDLKKGDQIKYKINDFEKAYSIDIIEKIKATNWKYLENTGQDKITLITCVENEPDYRLCVQATEITNINELPE